MHGLQLVRPGPEHLAAYEAALRRGWSADNLRGAAAAREELERIATDAAGFLARMDDPDAIAGPVTLPTVNFLDLRSTPWRGRGCRPSACWRANAA